jgi:glycosyltransferase involved in cell wall biosynthesis
VVTPQPTTATVLMQTNSSSVHRLPSRDRLARRLRVAVVAPPWIPVPPPGYGGIEVVVDLLCQGLVARGHDVTLFAAPSSHSSAHVYPVLEDAHPDDMGSSLYESDHVASAWDAIDAASARGLPFDVLHDHSGYTALAIADRVHAPVVHTIHGAFFPDTARFYRRHGHKAHLVAISRTQADSAPPDVHIADVVPNPIAVENWPLHATKEEYLLWAGRMDAVKGAHRAIVAARLAGRKLVLAGPIQPGQEKYFRGRVQPHIDGERVRYAGEVRGREKCELFANAAALLMPIRWREPFGMVMVEALACGTPVIAFPEGAASEIVIDAENGMLVDNEIEMAKAIRRLETIDPSVCRASVAKRYSVPATTARYERVYHQAIRAARARTSDRQLAGR